jgi:hypothetical protein
VFHAFKHAFSLSLTLMTKAVTVFTPDKIFLQCQTFQEKAKSLSRAKLGQAPAFPAEKKLSATL